MLVYASHYAALFARGERLALETIDAVVETPLDEVGVHLMPDPSVHASVNGIDNETQVMNLE